MRGGWIRISKIAIAHEGERRPSMVNQWQAELLARRPLRIITPEIIVLLIRRHSRRRLTSQNTWLASLFVLTKGRVWSSLCAFQWTGHRISKPDNQFSKYPLIFRVRCFEYCWTPVWPALTIWDTLCFLTYTHIILALESKLHKCVIACNPDSTHSKFSFRLWQGHKSSFTCIMRKKPLRSLISDQIKVVLISYAGGVGL